MRPLLLGLAVAGPSLVVVLLVHLGVVRPGSDEPIAAATTAPAPTVPAPTAVDLPELGRGYILCDGGNRVYFSPGGGVAVTLNRNECP